MYWPCGLSLRSGFHQSKNSEQKFGVSRVSFVIAKALICLQRKSMPRLQRERKSADIHAVGSVLTPPSRSTAECPSGEYRWRVRRTPIRFLQAVILRPCEAHDRPGKFCAEESSYLHSNGVEVCSILMQLNSRKRTNRRTRGGLPGCEIEYPLVTRAEKPLLVPLVVNRT